MISWLPRLLCFIASVLDCAHRHTTFPRARKDEQGQYTREHYVVCLDCARELPHPWAEMGQINSEKSAKSVDCLEVSLGN